MKITRTEITGTGAWDQREIDYNACHVRFRYLRGSTDAEIALNNTSVVHIKLGPPGGVYATEVQMQLEEGISRFGINAVATVDIEVTTWR